jgi:hypothetical protein
MRVRESTLFNSQPPAQNASMAGRRATASAVVGADGVERCFAEAEGVACFP